MQRMGAHEIQPFLHFLVHIYDLALAFIHRSLGGIIDWMQPARPLSGSAIVVSQPKLQTENRTQRHERVQFAVIPNGPGDAAKQRDLRDGHRVRRWGAGWGPRSLSAADRATPRDRQRQPDQQKWKQRE